MLKPIPTSAVHHSWQAPHLRNADGTSSNWSGYAIQGIPSSPLKPGRSTPKPTVGKVTGSWVALRLALGKLARQGSIAAMPLRDSVAAVSCGMYQGVPILDLEYAEDSTAEADANFVLTGKGGIVEIQGTAERAPFDRAQLDGMLELAQQGIAELTKLQLRAVGGS